MNNKIWIGMGLITSALAGFGLGIALAKMKYEAIYEEKSKQLDKECDEFKRKCENEAKKNVEQAKGAIENANDAINEYRGMAEKQAEFVKKHLEKAREGDSYSAEKIENFMKTIEETKGNKSEMTYEDTVEEIDNEKYFSTPTSECHYLTDDELDDYEDISFINYYGDDSVFTDDSGNVIDQDDADNMFGGVNAVEHGLEEYSDSSKHLVHIANDDESEAYEITLIDDAYYKAPEEKSQLHRFRKDDN